MKSMNGNYVLYFDDSETTLTKYMKSQKLINVIFVRFSYLEHLYDDSNLSENIRENIFWIDILLPIEIEHERFLNWIRNKNVCIKYFFNSSELGQYYAQRFAKLLHLDCLSLDQTIASKNKYIMKKKFDEMHLNVTNYKLIMDKEQLKQCSINMNYPQVIKPVDSSSCRDVNKIEKLNDIEKLDVNSKNYWLLEEFIELDEYAVDVLVFNNEIVDFYISKYPTPLLQALGEGINGSVTMRRISEYKYKKVEKILNTFIKSFNLDKGIFHMEFFSDDEFSQIYIGEVGIRPPGSEMLQSHELAYGFNIFEKILEIHINIKPKIEYKTNKFIGLLLLPIKNGIVDFITDIMDLIGRNGVIKGEIYFSEGELISKSTTSFSSSGYLLIEGDDEHEVVSNMEDLLKFFTLEVR